MPERQRLSAPGTDHGVMRCIVDGAGNLVFATPAVGWALGVDATTLSGRPAAEFIDIVSAGGDSAASGLHEVALLRQKRDPVLMQARIDRIDAPDSKKYTVVWLDPHDRLKNKPVSELDRAARDFAALVVDSKKKTDEDATVPDLEHISPVDGELRHFLNLTSDLLGVYRRDGSFVRVNSSFNRSTGYSDAELRLSPFIELIVPEDRDAAASAIADMFRRPVTQEPRVDFEGRVRCKTGDLRWMKWSHKAVGDHVYVVGRDVTDLKQRESELCRREEQLLEAQKIGRMGHWHWEAGQQYIELSDQIYAIFGVERQNFEPTVSNINALLVKQDLGRIYRAFQSALVRQRDCRFEFRLRRPGGGLRFIRCEGRCKINSLTGKVEALFGIMQDVTERKLYEKALREAKDAAESAYASKTRFLANMSHELRTPLNAIIGFSEMIQRQLLGPVGNARYLEYIAGIRESGEHLLDLINDILDMSKIEVGKYELFLEEINVGKLIRLAVHMVEGRAEESSVRLIADNIPDDVQALADRRALMQIVLNLLSNAVKFTGAGGSVEIFCRNGKEAIDIVVADTGVGIPKDKIATVVLPFEQVGNELTRKHEGSGLGLAITKDLIDLHGGALDISSRVGVGTTVTVTLPKKIPCRKKA